MTSSFHSPPPDEAPNPFREDDDDEDDHASSGAASDASPPDHTEHERPVPERSESAAYAQQRVQQSVQEREEPLEISIIDAVKTTEGAKSSYIAYIVQHDNQQVARRYSDFESLRTALSRLYPTLIIPPIPSKHTLGDYAAKQGKAKEDTALVARRRRTLLDFLNRIARHPILSNEAIFVRFLTPGVSWSEVLHSPPLSLLPKNPLHAPSYAPTDVSHVTAYASLPAPSAAHPLKRPDQRFIDSELFTQKFAQHLEGSMEKVNRRAVKRWSDAAADYSELGAILNGFSLSESDALASAIEKTGQAVDSTFMSTASMLQEWEKTYTEPLHTYSQFASIIKKLLAYRHMKHVQYEMVSDTLDGKHESLAELERSEREARRLEDALTRGSVIGLPPPAPASGSGSQPSSSSPGPGGPPAREESDGGDSSSSPFSKISPPASPVPTDARQPPPPPPAPKRAGGGGGSLSFLGALSHTLQGIMDVDPEMTRRNQIGKTRDAINGLEDALQASTQDLKYASQTIQADLDRFQRQKVADFREMCIAYAKLHREWARINLEAWEEAKREIEKIEPDPNRVPRGGSGSGGGPAGAGPSGAGTSALAAPTSPTSLRHG